MGRAIDDGKTLVDHEKRITLIEDALEEMLQTRVHHVDLNSIDEHERKIREENSRAEGVALEPDEEYTAPVGKRKKTTKKTKAVATT